MCDLAEEEPLEARGRHVGGPAARGARARGGAPPVNGLHVALAMRARGAPAIS